MPSPGSYNRDRCGWCRKGPHLGVFGDPIMAMLTRAKVLRIQTALVDQLADRPRIDAGPLCKLFFGQ